MPLHLTRTLAALSLVSLISAAPALAQDQKSPETLALEGIQNVIRAMELFIDTLPMYEAPEILPNGDIIIRRIPPGTEPRTPQDQADEDDTVKDI